MAATAAAFAPARLNDEMIRADVNRANAQHSTGPRTDEGKAVSSRNATKHGLFTAISALPAHEREILDRFLEKFGPGPEVRSSIADACTRWALLRYRIDKCQRLEFAYLSQACGDICETDRMPFPEEPEACALLEARAFAGDCKGPKVIARLHSHEARLERELKRTIQEFADLCNLDREECAASEAFAESSGRAEPPVPEPDLASFCQTTHTPRSAACPCGSGLKFKRCCGKQAPPVLNMQGFAGTA